MKCLVNVKISTFERKICTLLQGEVTQILNLVNKYIFIYNNEFIKTALI